MSKRALVAGERSGPPKGLPARGCALADIDRASVGETARLCSNGHTIEQDLPALGRDAGRATPRLVSRIRNLLISHHYTRH